MVLKKVYYPYDCLLKVIFCSTNNKIYLKFCTGGREVLFSYCALKLTIFRSIIKFVCMCLKGKQKNCYIFFINILLIIYGSFLTSKNKIPLI